MPLLAQWYTDRAGESDPRGARAILVAPPPLEGAAHGTGAKRSGHASAAAAAQWFIVEFSPRADCAHRRCGTFTADHPRGYDSGLPAGPLPHPAARHRVSISAVSKYRPAPPGRDLAQSAAAAGLMQPVSATLLEQFVFSKPYFDPAGPDRGAPRRHAASASFTPASVRTTTARRWRPSMGTTYLLMLENGTREPDVADELLARARAYLRDRGATVLYGGGIRPLNAFLPRTLRRQRAAGRARHRSRAR